METSKTTWPSEWQNRFLCFALLYSTFSKDPSTKVGCVLVDDKNTPIGFGTNGFSRTYKYDEETFSEREEKYKRVLHAEENAIYNSTGNTEGATAYLTHPPCLHCCHVLAQNGIKHIYAIRPKGEFALRWNLDATKGELIDLGVGLTIVDEPKNKSLYDAIDQWQKIVRG